MVFYLFSIDLQFLSYILLSVSVMVSNLEMNNTCMKVIALICLFPIAIPSAFREMI